MRPVAVAYGVWASITINFFSIVAWKRYASNLVKSAEKIRNTDSDQENPYVPFTTGNLVFAVCAKVYRVQIHGHTTNINFAECAQENTRQN